MRFVVAVGLWVVETSDSWEHVAEIHESKIAHDWLMEIRKIFFAKKTCGVKKKYSDVQAMSCWKDSQTYDQTARFVISLVSLVLILAIPIVFTIAGWFRTLTLIVFVLGLVMAVGLIASTGYYVGTAYMASPYADWYNESQDAKTPSQVQDLIDETRGCRAAVYAVSVGVTILIVAILFYVAYKKGMRSRRSA